MPKFGQVHYGKNYFGDSLPPTENYKRSYANIPLGIRVRRQLGKKVIFRVRRGNGHAGSIAGVAYQDKYKYVVPSSINNEESAEVRTLLTEAVYNWKNILTDAQKKDIEQRAANGLHMSGYNLYIREYIQSNI